MFHIGDRLGLFKALAHGQWVTLEELAQQTGYTTRYLREWLGSMVTGNYLAYDPQSRSYRLPAEFVPVLADEDSPYFAGGIIQLSVPFVSMAPKIIEAFRCGGGCPEESFPLETWEGMERMTMPLVQALPRAALDSFAGWRQGKAPGGWQRARFRLRQRAGRDHDGQGVPRSPGLWL